MGWCCKYEPPQCVQAKTCENMKPNDFWRFTKRNRNGIVKFSVWSIDGLSTLPLLSMSSQYRRIISSPIIRMMCLKIKSTVTNVNPGCITGWWYTYPCEKYEFVSWDDDIPNIWKNKKCSKPPIRLNLDWLIMSGTPIFSVNDQQHRVTGSTFLQDWHYINTYLKVSIHIGTLR